MTTAAVKSGTVSLRCETKYAIGEAVRVALLHDLRLITEPDPHSSGVRQGYSVKSLYFDTPGWANYHDKVDGLPQRIKFRIRQYDGDPQTRRLEAKEKIVDRVRKHQVLLNDETYRALIQGLLPIRDDPTINRFVEERARTGLRPCVVVTYQRHALVAQSDPSVRVTIDTGLRGNVGTDLEATAPGGCPVFPPGRSILELKWRRGFPFWFHTLVQKYNLRNTPLSKYVMTIDALTRAGSLARG